MIDTGIHSLGFAVGGAAFCNMGFVVGTFLVTIRGVGSDQLSILWSSFAEGDGSTCSRLLLGRDCWQLGGWTLSPARCRAVMVFVHCVGR